jgi:hypothetical protein
MPMIWPAHVLVGQILATNQSGSYFQGNFSWSYYAIFPHKGPRLSFLFLRWATRLQSWSYYAISCYIVQSLLFDVEVCSVYCLFFWSYFAAILSWSLFCLLPSTALWMFLGA